MSLTDYAGLKQAVIDHLERSDLSDHVDDFIDIAEARHKREIRIREALVRGSLSISENDRYLDLPANFLDLKYIRIIDPLSGYREFLRDFSQVSIHELTLKSINGKDRPRWFSVHSQIELNCEADRAYTGDIFYYKALTPLSDSNASNELLAKAPDAYLYAALSASAPFLMHDERVVLWEGLYTQVRDSLTESEQDNRRGGPLVARVKRWR